MTIDVRTGRLSGTPTTTGVYRPTVTVADAYGSDVQSFAWTITAVGGSSTGSAMSAVSFSFSPAARQTVGAPVVVSASGQGGSTPMYRFWVQRWGGSWRIMQDWSTASSWTWRPLTISGHNVTVDGRGRSAGDADVTSSATFEVVAVAGTGGGGTGSTQPMTSVALSFTPTTPQVVGSAVTLTAQGQGGSGPPMYRFLAQPWGGAWQVLQDWSASRSVTWRPATAGGYNLTVYGRNSTAGNGVSTSRTFEATGTNSGGTSPMTSVALSFTPATPQLVGTSVVMTAQRQGGSGTAMYLFLVQPWGGAWQTVQNWSTSPAVTWRPSAAGGYNLTVYGRRGTTGNGDTSASRTFEARR